MNLAHKTLQAVETTEEQKQESSFREHLGASIIGKPCSREIFYSFRWALEVRHKAQLLRLFNRGQEEEARFISRLQAAGLELWPFNPDAPLKNGKSQQWKVSAHNGHFGGSLDGVGRGSPDLPPEVPFVTEYKTHGADSFKKLVEVGVIAAKWEHFVQMQVYMHEMRLLWALYCAVNKNTDDWHLELIQYDKEIAENAIVRGGNIIYANEPPLKAADSPSNFKCKFCNFKNICHLQGVPAVNCRTCQFSRPSVNGLWFCGIHSADLTGEMQRKACPSYQRHTKF